MIFEYVSELHIRAAVMRIRARLMGRGLVVGLVFGAGDVEVVAPIVGSGVAGPFA